MPPKSETATCFNRFLAGKLSSLSENEISLLADDALTNLVESELSRLSQDEFNRLAEAELSPFVPIVEGVLQALLSEIFPPLEPKANAKAKEEEQTSHPVTFDGILVLTLATVSSFIVIKRCVRNLCQLLYRRFKRDAAVTTIAPQVTNKLERLLSSNRPIFHSKYSRTADVQGLKGIRYIRKAKTVFTQLMIQESFVNGESFGNGESFSLQVIRPCKEKQSWGKEVCSEVDNGEIHHQGIEKHIREKEVCSEVVNGEIHQDCHFCHLHNRYSI